MPGERDQGPAAIFDSGLDYRFREVVDVASWIPDLSVIASDMGPGGDLLALATTREAAGTALSGTESPGGVVFPATRADHPYKGVLIHLNQSGELTNHLELSEVFVAHPHVQPLPADRYLVVGSRTRRFADGSFEKNAYIYGQDGRIEGEFLMGDGIADVQCDGAGNIWTAYFDEGIFGNFGWNEPVGAPGLLCFDSQGQMTWHFEPPAGFDSMADCYALNVASSTDVYVYYYGDFAVMRISRDKPIEAWPTPIHGSGALAIFAEHAALLGSYHERDRVFVGRLAPTGLINIVSHRFVFAGVDGPIGPGKLRGRGSRFARMVGTRWFRCDMRELFAA